MMVRVPSVARSVPPLMGASRNMAPRFSAAAAQAFEVDAPTVL